jgi:hypothetical protein
MHRTLHDITLLSFHVNPADHKVTNYGSIVGKTASVKHFVDSHATKLVKYVDDVAHVHPYKVLYDKTLEKLEETNQRIAEIEARAESHYDEYLDRIRNYKQRLETELRDYSNELLV